jgi:flagellar biogenesis protein FliO
MTEIYRQFGGIVLVLLMLAGLLWFAKRRGLARLGFRNRGGERIVTVLERVSLTPQHTLHVLVVGGRRLLLTSSPGNCQLITELPNEPQIPNREMLP